MGEIPVPILRLGSPTWRNALPRLTLIVPFWAFFCVYLVALAPDFAAVGIPVITAAAILLVLTVQEVVVAGRQVWRRSWLRRILGRSWIIADLPADITLVHKMRGQWSLWPGGPDLPLLPWEVVGVVANAARAGIPVNDWWSGWAGRHVRLDRIGVAAWFGLLVVYPGLLIAELATPGSISSQNPFHLASSLVYLLGWGSVLIAEYVPWYFLRLM
jgi:hypothetical protein